MIDVLIGLYQSNINQFFVIIGTISLGIAMFLLLFGTAFVNGESTEKLITNMNNYLKFVVFPFIMISGISLFTTFIL